MSSLRQIVQHEIAAAGVIPFSRFMELALYCPSLGYYERADTQIGKGGDFYTSVSVGSLFGELLAFQFDEWMEGRACLVEAGAHDGRLAQDILRWFRIHRPEAYEQVQYWVVEPSPVRKARQRQTLEEFAGKVRWYESLAALPEVTGIIFSNELLDAFPVSRYVWSAGETTWFEAGVGIEGEQFVWRRCPAPAGVNQRTFSPAEFFTDTGLDTGSLLDVLPDGHIVDNSHAAAGWWREAARKLERGKLLTLDYGLTAEQLFAPERRSGTLRAYHKHHQSADLLANIGEQDLTAHVNFTQLKRAGQSEGLQTDALLSQDAFLIRIAQRILAAPTTFPDWTPERIRRFQTLTHPNHLGHVFQVLVQVR